MVNDKACISESLYVGLPDLLFLCAHITRTRFDRFRLFKHCRKACGMDLVKALYKIGGTLAWMLWSPQIWFKKKIAASSALVDDIIFNTFYWADFVGFGDYIPILHVVQNCVGLGVQPSIQSIVEIDTCHRQGCLANTNPIQVSRRTRSKHCKKKFGGNGNGWQLLSSTETLCACFALT